MHANTNISGGPADIFLGPNYSDFHALTNVINEGRSNESMYKRHSAKMESLRPWPWPRGASRTTGHILGLGLGGQVLGLGLGGQVLGLGLGRRVLGLGLGKHVLGLDHFRLMCLVLCKLY